MATQQQGPPPTPPASEQRGRAAVERVVLIGSSAGGLDALSALLAAIPADLAAAYVVAQHLAPDHDSQLVALLTRVTSMPVLVAADGAALRPGVVLVAPPNTDVTIEADRVRVAAPGSEPGPNPSIDVLMRSAAASWGERAVGIVLSGTGSDGSAGLRAISEKDGLTIVQEPVTAQFDAMPRAAIAAGPVDLVLAPGDMGAALGGVTAGLASLWQADREERNAARLAPTPASADAISAVVAALRGASGLDFTDYKRGTLERQIARRQLLVDEADPSAYAALVAAGGSEADSLVRALLVTVTSFFRDPASWEALAGVLRERLGDLGGSAQLRIWVPGCATGEEAYTTAMIAAQVLGAGADLSGRLKLFATDLSDPALDVARRGHYSQDATSPIPPQLRERWLRRTPTGWEVTPGLRDAVIFARHNVAADPPFPRVNLVCLRNTLIYFNPSMQERVLSLCHFSLVPGGLLFLGQSERPTGPAGAFDVVSDEYRIYRRSGASLPVPVPAPATAVPATPRGRLSPVADQRLVLHDALIKRFTPPALVVDANDDVIEVIGDVSAWCWVAPGQPSADVVALLRDELRAEVRSVLVQARRGAAAKVVRTLVTSTGSRAQLEVRPVGPAESEWLLLAFLPVPDASTADTPIASHESADTPEADPDAQLRAVTAELDYTRSALQSTAEDLSASNEELRALNEELQASAEELQASSEEVQATNEELQATNEELSVLNQELRVRGLDLAVINSRSENIQGSLSSGMVVVDRDLRVTQFTPLAVRLFVLIDADLGRPLTTVTTTVSVPGLEAILRDCVEHRAHSMLEVSGPTNVFLVAFQPYLHDGDEPAGAIIVVTDVTELARTRQALAASEHRYQLLAENSSDVVWERDTQGALQWVSPSVTRVLGWAPEHLVGTSVAEIVHADDLPKVQGCLADLWGGELVAPFEVRIRRDVGDYRWMSLQARTLRSADGSVTGALAGLRDIHAQVLARNALADSERRYRMLAENASDMVWQMDTDGRLVWVSPSVTAKLGWDRDQLLGTSSSDLVHPDDREATTAWHAALAGGGEIPALESRRLAADGTYRWMSLHGRLVHDGTGQVVGRIIGMRDIQDEVAARTHLAHALEHDQLTGLATLPVAVARTRRLLAALPAGSPTSVGVLCVGIDSLKTVNEALTHAGGDRVMLEVAARIATVVADPDRLARGSGDEFLVLLPNLVTGADAGVVADQIRRAVHGSIKVGSQRFEPTVSVGIAIGGAGAESDQLFRDAAMAMRQAKARGRDRCEFLQAGLAAEAEHRLIVEDGLREGLRQGRMVAWFQPIVALPGGGVVGYEALARLIGPDGIIEPAGFLPVAERTSLICDVDIAILRQALDLLATLPDPMHVAVNVSAQTLARSDYASELRAELARSGADPARLHCEFTETALLQVTDRVRAVMADLTELGVRWYVDDFGTGYSSISHLRDLPIAGLKLDLSFTSGMRAGEKTSKQLSQALIGLARGLSLDTVAEGVETAQDADLLAVHGWRHAQGWLYGHAQPAASIQAP